MNTYMQMGYVTNDIDCAVDAFRACHGMGPFKLMRDLDLPTGPGRSGRSHYALAFLGDLQFELIQPVAGDVDFYAQALDKDGFSLRFHHTGRFFASREAFEATQTAHGARWSIVAAGDVSEGRYCYFDARGDFGHFLEIFTFPDSEHLDGVPRY